MGYKIVLEGPVEVEHDDGGQAQFAQIDSVVEGELSRPVETNDGFFVRLQSWSEGHPPHHHPELEFLNGKRVRVTVEVID